MPAIDIGFLARCGTPYRRPCHARPSSPPSGLCRFRPAAQVVETTSGIRITCTTSCPATVLVQNIARTQCVAGPCAKWHVPLSKIRPSDPPML